MRIIAARRHSSRTVQHMPHECAAYPASVSFLRLSSPRPRETGGSLPSWPAMPGASRYSAYPRERHGSSCSLCFALSSSATGSCQASRPLRGLERCLATTGSRAYARGECRNPKGTPLEQQAAPRNSHRTSKSRSLLAGFACRCASRRLGVARRGQCSFAGSHNL